MALKKNQENYPPLDQREKNILKKTSLPPVFAQFLKEKSLSLGVAFALRASSCSARYLMPASPKPISVKAKTGNWNFAKGVISVDTKLGRIEKKNGEWKLIHRDKKDIPSDTNFLKSVIHKLSLQEILISIHSGEYNIINTEKDINSTGRIILNPINHPRDSDFIFSINFKENPIRIEPQCPIDLDKLLITPLEKVDKPAWWNDQWGEFETCINNYYPAQYKHANDNTFSDILAYGIEDQNGQVLPITSDQDFLWISSPHKKYDAFLKEFSETIDTSNPQGVEKLYKARLALHLKLGGTPEQAEQSISNSSISGVGHVTAYESYVIDEINKDFSTCGVKHLRNLIQHAADNHNPDKPSALDTLIIHFWHGKIFITHNEHELIEFFMQPDYPNENMIDIHPKWNMKEWAPVILVQLLLKQPVPQKTMLAFKNFKKQNEKSVFFGVNFSKSLKRLSHHKGRNHE